MRKWLTIIVSIIGIALLIIAVAGPIGPVAGIRIGGETTPVPASWSSVQLPDEVLLKTSGSVLPWVVTIWIVGDENALYVFGAAGSSWVKNALADPLVELRIHDRTYALKATPLDPPDPAIYQKYIDRYATDYPDIVAGMPKADEVEGVGSVFRLSPR
jgi:hypothetical protein